MTPTLPAHRMRFAAWPSTPEQVVRWVSAHLRRAGRAAGAQFEAAVRQAAEAFEPRAEYRVVCWPAGEAVRVELEPIDPPQANPPLPADLAGDGVEWGALPDGGVWLEAPTVPCSPEE